MVRWAALALLCGCNPVFGIDSTELIDAPPPPPPIDAPIPFACPEDGTAPVFGTSLTMVPEARDCVAYTTTPTGTAAAVCGGFTAVVMTGAVDTPLAPVTLDPATMNYIEGVRIAPEGNDVYVAHYDVNWTRVTTRYQAVDGIWKQQGKSFTPERADGYSMMSTPTQGAARRAVIQAYDVNFALELLELEETADEGWVPKRSTPLADLGVTAVFQPSLSPDGLRLVFIDTGYQSPTMGDALPPSNGNTMQPVFYTDRADLASPFRPAKMLETVPGLVQWPYMTPDCGRIYFSALNTVWYLEQPR